MPANKRSEHHRNAYPHARPFDEFLIQNSIGNHGNAIYSGDNLNHVLSQYQSQMQQTNASPVTFPQTTVYTTMTAHPTVHTR